MLIVIDWNPSFACRLMIRGVTNIVVLGLDLTFVAIHMANRSLLTLYIYQHPICNNSYADLGHLTFAVFQ